MKKLKTYLDTSVVSYISIPVICTSNKMQSRDTLIKGVADTQSFFVRRNGRIREYGKFNKI